MATYGHLVPQLILISEIPWLHETDKYIDSKKRFRSDQLTLVKFGCSYIGGLPF